MKENSDEKNAQFLLQKIIQFPLNNIYVYNNFSRNLCFKSLMIKLPIEPTLSFVWSQFNNIIVLICRAIKMVARFCYFFLNFKHEHVLWNSSNCPK